jgi:hypothetical protein
MSAPIAYLYEEAKELSLLGQVLCDIEYYQEARIKKFNLERQKCILCIENSCTSH